MDYGSDVRNSLTYSQDSMPLSDSATDTVPPESNPPQDDLFALIDLAAPNPPHGASYVQKLGDPALSSKAFAEDLAGLQPTPMDLSKMTSSKRNSTEAASLLPLQTRSLRRSKRGGNRFDELSHNRCSTPESIASEIRRAQAMVDPIPVDPYTQWYQLMQNYYKRFYPGYEFGSPAASSLAHRAQRHVPISAVPLTQTTPQAVNQQQMQQQPQPPFNFPGWPPMSVQGRSRVPGNKMQMPGFGQVSDYAAYYYQYYMGAWAAANGWPVPTGRTTPKVFIEPHIRATLATPGFLIQLGRIYVAAFANDLLRKLANDSDNNIKDDIIIWSVSTILAFYETKQPDIGHWKSFLIIAPEDQ
ncbi:hypothetical protein ACTXT7_005123 [Hymenolepis weldensis]